MPNDMPRSSRIDEVLKKAKRLVTPSDEEREQLRRTLEEALDRVRKAIEDLSLDAEPVAVGSAVRDTWLPGNRELDIFILFPPREGLDKKLLEEIIEDIARIAFGSFRKEYAEHPYAVVELNGFQIDLVPAFRIEPGGRIISAVDRTPLHSEYVKERLKSPLDVRLLKAFLKSIGAYGAEIRVGGFSGYLTELLVINYGGFIEVLESAVTWVEPVVIDIEAHLDPRHALSIFGAQSPLVVIDPVDPRRNAAAALTRTQFYRFKAAAKAFLANPDLEFFERGLKEGRVPITQRDLISEVERRGTKLLIIRIEIGEGELSKEVLWSQAKRLARMMGESLREQGFDPIWVEGYTDEDSVVVAAAELPSLSLPPMEIKVGPKVGMEAEVNFLRKYTGEGVFGGPFILEDRWYVYRRRKYTNALDLINDFVRSNRMPSQLRGRRSFSILTDRELTLLEEEILAFLWKEIRKEEFFARKLAEAGQT